MAEVLSGSVSQCGVTFVGIPASQKRQRVPEGSNVGCDIQGLHLHPGAFPLSQRALPDRWMSGGARRVGVNDAC